MKENRITVFNCVVDKHLEDCSYFEEFLDNHYRKFSYGYNIIAKDKLLDKIQDVECEMHSNELKFIITFKKSISNKILKSINERMGVVYGAELFDASTENTSDNTLVIDIYCK